MEGRGGDPGKVYRHQVRSLGRGASNCPDKSNLIRTIRHQVERLLDLEFTEENPTTAVKTAPRMQEVTGGAAAMVRVENWRQPRSLTTLSWIDGHVGRGYVTYRKGTIPEKVQAWAAEHFPSLLGQSEWLPLSFKKFKQHMAAAHGLIVMLWNCTRDSPPWKRENGWLGDYFYFGKGYFQGLS